MSGPCKVGGAGRSGNQDLELPITSNDDAVLRGFESGRLAAHALDHAQHVRVAWHHVTTWPLLEAVRRQVVSVAALTAAAGVPEKFHATLTIAWVLEIAERCRQTPEATTWEAFARRNPDLLHDSRAVLSTHYSAEALNAQAARDTFVIPDRVPDAVRPPRS